MRKPRTSFFGALRAYHGPTERSGQAPKRMTGLKSGPSADPVVEAAPAKALAAARSARLRP
jgi:hypothetical protein